MYLCICRGITEETLRRHINSQNAHAPATEILKQLGIGTDCGVCLLTAIDQIQQETLKKSQKD